MKKLLLGVMLFSSLIVNNSCDSSEIVENKTIKSSNSKQIKKLMKSAFLIAVLNNESTPKVNNANITVATATTIVEDCKSAHFGHSTLYLNSE